MQDFKLFAILTENYCKYLFYQIETIKGEIRLYSRNNEKILKAPQVKSLMISPLLFYPPLGCQKKLKDPAKFILRVWVAVFKPKNAKNCNSQLILMKRNQVFECHSNLARKQQTKHTDSFSFIDLFCFFGHTTHFHGGMIVEVEKCWP